MPIVELTVVIRTWRSDQKVELPGRTGGLQARPRKRARVRHRASFTGQIPSRLVCFDRTEDRISGKRNLTTRASAWRDPEPPTPHG